MYKRHNRPRRSLWHLSLHSMLLVVVKALDAHMLLLILAYYSCVFLRTTHSVPLLSQFIALGHWITCTIGTMRFYTSFLLIRCLEFVRVLSVTMDMGNKDLTSIAWSLIPRDVTDLELGSNQLKSFDRSQMMGSYESIMRLSLRDNTDNTLKSLNLGDNLITASIILITLRPTYPSWNIYASALTRSEAFAMLVPLYWLRLHWFVHWTCLGN